jgi:oligo-1,6-glucosidase
VSILCIAIIINNLWDISPNFSYEQYIIDFDNDKVYAYTREYQGKSFLVVCNFRGVITKFNTQVNNLKTAKLLLHNYNFTPKIDQSTIQLQPFEALVFEVNSDK